MYRLASGSFIKASSLSFRSHLLIKPFYFSLVGIFLYFPSFLSLGKKRRRMERSVRLVSVVFLVLMLLAATETGKMVAEARTCESQSHRFKGTCVRKSNCAAVCQTEGFPDGYCRGFRRRCFCSKHC